MKRSDFFKTLGALALAPLAAKSVCDSQIGKPAFDTKKIDNRISKLKEEEFAYVELPYPEPNHSRPYIGDCYVDYSGNHYIVTSLDGDYAILKAMNRHSELQTMRLSVKRPLNTRNLCFTGHRFFMNNIKS